MIAARLVFRCEHCRSSPDRATHRTLERQPRDRGEPGRYSHADPGGWLVWTGGGRFGEKRYACPRHVEELVEDVRVRYGRAAG